MAFVADDYDRFNVEESRVRSQQWISLPNVDRSRIGRKSYWEQQVVPRMYQPGMSCENGAKPMEESLAKLQIGQNSPEGIPEDNDQWMNSTEARKRLKVSTCDLAHLRNAGKIESKKVGNAYYYKVDVGIDAHDNVDSTTK
jgi:hypothetical protein